MKFGRTYSMRIQTDPELDSVVIGFPMTLEFQITRNTFASANTARFTIYNLGEDTRRQVFHDRYDTFTYRQVILQAGYESDNNTPLATIFQGNVQSAYSYRRKENWTTVLDCFDGGFGIINGQISMSVSPSQSTSQVIASLIQAMPNVAVGIVDVPDTQKARGSSFFGNAWDIIRRLAGNNTAYIDNEKANVVPQGT